MYKTYLFLSLFCCFPFLLTAGEGCKKQKLKHQYDVVAIFKKLPSDIGIRIIAHMAEACVNKVVSVVPGHYEFYTDMLALHKPFTLQPNQIVIPFESQDKRTILNLFYNQLTKQKQQKSKIG